MRDILILVWDDVGYDDCSSTVTPNLTTFRADGIDFPLAFSMQGCSQTRTCLHYGVLGRSIGILGDTGPSIPPHPIPDLGWPTIAQALSDEGYKTCLVGKWHSGHAPSDPTGNGWEMAPIERGFDSWLAGSKANVTSFSSWERIDADQNGFVASIETRYATLAQVEAAEDWWITTTGPRFLMVCLNEPHVPFEQPPPELAPLLPPLPTPTQRQRYLNKLTAADTVLGRFLALSGMDQAVVACLSDNGTPGAGARTSKAGKVKGTTFDGGIHVPLVMRWPGSGSLAYDELVHVVDVPAACLTHAGPIQLPDEWDGRVLPPRKHVICEGMAGNGAIDQCARGKRYKLRNVVGVEEFYDLESDPGENAPLDLNAPAIQQQLTALRAMLY